jgi:protein associated with RNAse G/E
MGQRKEKIMRQDFLVECRSYEKAIRGSWRGSRVDADALLGDEQLNEHAQDLVRVWVPAGTPMNWATGTRPLRYHSLQFFWPERWYMLSAFYDGLALIHTYATIIQPATIGLERLSYTDLDLSMLVKPDFSYEVLTQAEFEQAAEMLHYDEETRIGALMALDVLTQAVHRRSSLFTLVPHLLQDIPSQPLRCGH